MKPKYILENYDRILKEIKNSFGRRMKLDQIAEATLGTKKSGHGLEAVEWWKKGEKEKVKKYGAR